LSNALKTEHTPTAGYLPCGDRRPGESPQPDRFKNGDKADKDKGGEKSDKGKN